MSEDVTSAEVWLEAGANDSITVEQLDGLVKDYSVKRAEYEAVSAESKVRYKEAEDAKRKCLEAMRQAGKQKYHVDGIATVWVTSELVVPTPKTAEAKQLLFDHIRKEYGEPFLMEKLAIHHATLQSLYREAYREAVEQGHGDSFHMPGLEEPTDYKSLSFRKG